MPCVSPGRCAPGLCAVRFAGGGCGGPASLDANRASLTLEASSRTDALDEVVRLARDDEKREENAHLPLNERDPEDITVGEALDLWAETFQVRPATLEDYKRSVRLYKKKLGEKRLLREVTLHDLEALFFKTWAERSGRTLVKHRMNLSRFWRWCVNHGYARVNLVERLETPKKWRREARQAARSTGQALTLEEARKLLTAAQEPYTVNFSPKGKAKSETELEPPERIWWAIFLALRTGLRLSNIVGTPHKPPLRWGDVHLEDETFEIAAEHMKNDRPALLPLHTELAEALRERLKELGRVPAASQPIAGADPSRLRKQFRAALKRSKIDRPGFRFHDLRTTFAVWIGETCTHAVMQRLLTHTATDVTSHYAQHQELETLRRGLNALPRLLTKKARGEKARKRGG